MYFTGAEIKIKKIILISIFALILLSSFASADFINTFYETAESSANITGGYSRTTSDYKVGSYSVYDNNQDKEDFGTPKDFNFTTDLSIIGNKISVASWVQIGLGYGVLGIVEANGTAQQSIEIAPFDYRSRIKHAKRVQGVSFTGISDLKTGNSSCGNEVAEEWLYMNLTVENTGLAFDIYIEIYNSAGTFLCSNGVTTSEQFLNVTSDDETPLTILFGDEATGNTGEFYDEIRAFDTVEVAPSNFSVTLTDIEGGSINNFTADINGTDYTTTTGTATANFVQGSGSVDIIIKDAIDENGHFFNKTYSSIDTSSNYVATDLYQAEISFEARELISLDVISGDFLLDDDSEAGAFYTAGNYNITFMNTSYFNNTQEFSFVALENETKYLFGVYSNIINVSVQNAYSGQNLTNFSGYIYSYDETYNATFNATGEYIELPTINGSYLIYVEAEGYSLSEDNFLNVSTDYLINNATFYLYSNNSVLINIYDEDTFLSVTDNISITISGNESEDIYYTATGQYFLEDLSDGSYTVKFSGDNYTLKSYVITVADRSTQTLNAYLSAISEDVTFTFLDYDSSAVLEGVSMTMYRQLNGSWTVVQTKLSDISGQALLQYVPDVQYKFFATFSGYDDKLFYLDPVLSSAYNIRMTKETDLTTAPSYSDVSLQYYPKTFKTNETNNFTFIIGSSAGSLETYSFNLTYPSSSSYRSGSNAIGEEFNVLFNITGAETFDYVNLSYCFDTTISSQKCYYYTYLITGQAGNNTHLSNLDNTFGLDLFSRIIIATVTVLIVAGLLSLFAGVLVGGAVGLVLFGYFSFIGFIPLWAILPSLLIGFILLARRTE